MEGSRECQTTKPSKSRHGKFYKATIIQCSSLWCVCVCVGQVSQLPGCTLTWSRMAAFYRSGHRSHTHESVYRELLATLLKGVKNTQIALLIISIQHLYTHTLTHQKLLIDEKSCYMFGRAKELCDFPLPHQSCSREHAALVYHKHLNRPFLIDLGSSESHDTHMTLT